MKRCFRYADSCLCGTSPEQDYSEGQQIFIARQLLTLMSVVDLSDEVGRYMWDSNLLVKLVDSQPTVD